MLHFFRFVLILIFFLYLYLNNIYNDILFSQEAACIIRIEIHFFFYLLFTLFFVIIFMFLFSFLFHLIIFYMLHNICCLCTIIIILIHFALCDLKHDDTCV